MNLGLDIDGTITDDPIFFARICREVLRGGEVHIVSSRSPEALQETIKELADLGCWRRPTPDCPPCRLLLTALFPASKAPDEETQYG